MPNAAEYKFDPLDTSEDGLNADGREFTLNERGTHRGHSLGCKAFLVGAGLLVLLGGLSAWAATGQVARRGRDMAAVNLLEMAYDEEVALAYLQYARASVCGHDEVVHWDCGEMCDAVPADPTAIRFLSPGFKYEVQGFVAALPAAYDHDQSSGRPGRHCVIAFRGSVNLKNWEADFDNVVSIEWPSGGGAAWCRNCLVGDGFVGAYGELHDQLFRAVDDLGCSDASFTGHSLGGAMAMMAAFELRSTKGFRGSPVYLFGSPRLGNEEFVAAFEAAAELRGARPPAWRVVHDKDPVPRLGAWNFGSRHPPQEVYYNEAQTSYRLCSPVNGDDPTCSASLPWYDCVKNAGMHLNYLNSSRVITCKHTGENPWKTHGRLY